MVKAKRAQAQDGPPVKKARVTATAKAKSDAPLPKFSLRIKGSPGPNKGKGKERAVDKAKKRREEEEEDDDDDDDEDDDEEHPALAKTKRAPQPRVLPTSFKIVAGSYEKLLYGLQGTISPSPSPSSPPTSAYTIALTPIFIFPAHVSCIKAAAASPAGGKWLATGSADEIIKIWDLRRRKEVGGLMHHEGASPLTHSRTGADAAARLDNAPRVPLALAPPLRVGGRHALPLPRARLERPPRAQGAQGPRQLRRGAPHRQGRPQRRPRPRAADVGPHARQGQREHQARKRRVPLVLLFPPASDVSTEGEIVRWSTDGALFAVQTGAAIDIYTTGMEVLHTIKHPSRLHDVHFCRCAPGATGELLLAAAEDKLVTVYAVSSDRQTAPKPIATLTGHLNRVKAVSTLEVALPAGVAPREATTLACTVSSDGLVHVYDLAMVPAPGDGDGGEVVGIAPVAVYDTKGTRLTCLTLADGDGDVGGGEAQAGEKRKEREGEESEEEGAEEWPSEQEEEEEEEESE
ncbi:hypothetical protein C0993_012658 [Termitomyces sp. T159_Od127]|nr:hypothetical protein C0993_012658 [Termitomyces sp. T159_Od127]